MNRISLTLSCAALLLTGAILSGMSVVRSKAASSSAKFSGLLPQQDRAPVYENRFQIQIIVEGRPLEAYYTRDRIYVEALKGAEYEVRLRNPLPVRVAVALSVDGLNSIDARRTSAWNASKWVIGPYETITVAGWQMSSERARRFYFTTEQDSYAARLGRAANLGLVTAVFFRERSPRPITIVPPPRPQSDERGIRKSDSPSASANEQGRAKNESGAIVPRPDDEYAATGIGRSVQNDVRWIDMELESHPVGEVNVRYEYYSGLVRLGILPRPYPRETLPRRERATGFEDRRFSPEP